MQLLSQVAKLKVARFRAAFSALLFLLPISFPLYLSAQTLSFNTIDYSHYQQISANESRRLYHIQAQTLEIHTMPAKQMAWAMVKRSTAEKLGLYQEGKIQIGQQAFEFKQAYLFQGKIYLKQVRFQSSQGNISAQEAVIDPQHKHFSSPRIVRYAQGKMSTRIRYQWQF